MKDLEIWAHRGGRSRTTDDNRYNNTLQAFQIACDKGVDGFETDIDQTKDGEPIVYHLETLKPDPINLSWIEAKSLYPFIIHFEDLLAFLSQNGAVQCCLELKNSSKEFLETVVLGVKVANLLERTFITAPQIKIKALQLPVSGGVLLEAKSISSSCKTHVIGLLPFDLQSTVQKVDASAISLGWLSTPTYVHCFTKFFFQRCVNTKFVNLPSQIKNLRARQTKVWGGIANTFEEMDYLTELGVQGLFTDEVELAMRYKR